MIHPIPNVKGKPTYSQYGEDLIIDHILNAVKSDKKFLVDLGAHTHHGSNSRLFLERGWQGIRIDGEADPSAPDIKQHWILRENIVALLENYGCPKEFGFLSIDLDGNDYHILKEIYEAGYRPDLICAEINPIWNKHQAAYIEYNPEHRFADNDYYGMSALAVELLLFDYDFVYLQDGINAYFVNRELLPDAAELCPDQYLENLKGGDWPKAEGDHVKWIVADYTPQTA